MVLNVKWLYICIIISIGLTAASLVQSYLDHRMISTLTQRTAMFNSSFEGSVYISQGYLRNNQENVALAIDKIDNVGNQVNNLYRNLAYVPVYEIFKPSSYCHKSLSNYTIITYNLIGTSMYPTCQVGDTVLGQRYQTNKPIVEGDIISYATLNRTTIIHRVSSTYRDCIVTKGDNNFLPDDGCVQPSMIQYVVCGCVR